jgi:hypothetical protein
VKRNLLPICLAITAGFTQWSARAVAADPTTADCLAASDASLKFGNEHKLRAERTQLLVCAAATCPADVRKECLRRVDEVNAAIPTIIFEARDAAGNDLSAVTLTMDGQLLSERLEGTPLSIDPGEHTFVFETAGQEPITRHLVVRESQKERREPVVFGAVAAKVSPPAPMVGAGVQPSSDATPPTPSLGTQKVVALVAAGVGVVGLGLGVTFGLIAISKKDEAEKACPATCASQDGVDKWSSAKSTGTLSTALFVVGGVGAVGADVLWTTAKPPAAGSIAAQLGITPGSVQLRGTW